MKCSQGRLEKLQEEVTLQQWRNRGLGERLHELKAKLMEKLL